MKNGFLKEKIVERGFPFDKFELSAEITFMKKLPITLAIITLNEEDNIERCIKSVPFADEVVVVDSFSTDRTVEIAQSLGAQVILDESLKKATLGKLKAKATDSARNQWVLSLDADEALSDELCAEILQKFSSLDSKTGYLLPRISFHLGRWIRYGGWYPDYQLRIFNREFAKWNHEDLHERVVVAQHEKFEKPIRHWVFKNLFHNVATNNNYSTRGTLQLIQKGKKFSYFHFITKPWVKFIECYFIKRGFLDGMPGFIIAVGAAYSIFLRHAKLWEHEIKNKA